MCAFPAPDDVLWNDVQWRGADHFRWPGWGMRKGQEVMRDVRTGLIWLTFFATILRRMPEDLHAWILTDQVPAFVGFEGALMTPGPVWRIELVSPRKSW